MSRTSPELWRKEYETKGVPSSFRNTPSETILLFLKYLERYRQTVSEKKIVELGSGLGRNCFFLVQKGAKVIGVDFVRENIEKMTAIAREHHLNLVGICGDVTSRLPFEDQSVDIVIDIFCYKHQINIQKRDSYRQEVLRVLKPDGYYVLSLADKKDGYYGMLKKEKDFPIDQVTDPNSGIGSVLFSVDDVMQEFRQFRFREIHTIQKSGPMYEQDYWRIVHHFIMQKDVPAELVNATPFSGPSGQA